MGGLVIYDNALRVSGTPESCGVRICVLGLTTCPPEFYKDMRSWADYMSPEFCEDMHSRVYYMSPEFYQDMRSRADHMSPSFAKMCALEVTISPLGSTRFQHTWHLELTEY
ncbi:unnamed protein product [Prunus armeniaca]